jgi:hypothetical protein
LVLPLEVVPPVVGVEGLTRSSPEDLVVCLTQDELGVGEALGLSLLEIRAWYFQNSDEGEDSEVSQDSVEEQNYSDVISNHISSGRYQTKDIDGVPYSSYRGGA